MEDGRFGPYWRFINPMIENAHEMFVIVSHIHELEEPGPADYGVVLGTSELLSD